jgi:hypothetical protein
VLESSVKSTPTQAEPIFARNVPRQPLHPVARLRQSKSRWYSTTRNLHAAVRRFTSSANQHSAGLKYDRAAFPKSRVGYAVNNLSGRSPFAHTLRPNLTGGTLNRSAGGYSLGGSARYFSHTPAAPAQVVHNVSQAIRAFLISGQKAQFNGVNPQTGEKRYKAVTVLQEEVSRKMFALPRATPGSFIDFNVNPTITALTPINSVAGYSQSFVPKENINTEGLIDVLSVDFSRSLKELAAVLNDIQRLAALGDLPITYHGTFLRIHFPGCDGDTVSKLCDELGVSNGAITQDDDFDDFVGTEIALLFPFAPSKTASECDFLEKPAETRIISRDQVDWRNMLSPESVSEPSIEYSTRSDAGLDFEEIENPWTTSPSGYESLHSSELDNHSFEKHTPLEYQGIEGIYRFMEQYR